MTICIASGDTGSESKIGDGKAHVQYPGSDPWVLSCGGTTIGSVSGTSFDKWVWNDGSGATGGGVSAIFPLPWYQVDAGVPGSVNDSHHGRGVPDVAANASVASGYPIIVGGSPARGNGTSASAPLWAGLTAVLNAALNENIGFVNPVLYALASSVFRDIVAEPGAADNSRFGTPGYPAGPGWDACTGWGTPKGKALLAGLHGFYGPAIAVNLQDNLDFGLACRKPRYRTVHVYNVGNRDLMILGVQRVSGSSDFTVLPAPATPLAIAPGAGIDFTIEYRPTVPGAAGTATIQITCNDTVNPTLDLVARGASGTGKLAVTGSTYLGGVRACCYEERTIWIANVGDCELHVSDVAFKHPAKAWKLVNNAFPATLHPGASLAVVIRYHAIERYARARELVITSDDPQTPVRELEVLAHTVWDEQCRDDCTKGCRNERGHCEPSPRSCERCPDEDDDQDQAEAYSPA